MNPDFLRNVLLRYMLLLGAMLAIFPCSRVFSQAVEVAKSSVTYVADDEKSTLGIGFRLVDGRDVNGVEAQTVEGGESVPATWEGWTNENRVPCAWMVVVDISNPSRKTTISKCREAVKAFIGELSEKDSMAIYALARDLDERSDFRPAAEAEELQAAADSLQPAGDASLTTLIYRNLLEGVKKLEGQSEKRRALLVFSDGKDETTNEVEQVKDRDQLIAAARKAGVVIHTIGYAESSDDQKFFTGLIAMSEETEGLHAAAKVKGKDLPEGYLGLVHAVMGGAGKVHLDLSGLVAADAPGNVLLSLTTAAGEKGSIEVPSVEVKKAFPKDTDGDGLLDRVENLTGKYEGKGSTGTDPNKSDTDGDGLADGTENGSGEYVSEADRGTDPNKADSDGDGLSDGVESGRGEYAGVEDTGTDPNKVDSDGDGLSDGVESGTGEYVGAEDTGTDPNKVDSDGDGISDGVESGTGEYAGAEDTGTDPNKADSDGDGLSDKVESATGEYVGVEDTGTDPNKADSDGDGLSDKVESATGEYIGPEDTGTNPHEEDTDGDGLSDKVESATGEYIGAEDAGTDPHEEDTDGDGISDGDEVEAGSDPLIFDQQKVRPILIYCAVALVLCLFILILVARNSAKKKRELALQIAAEQERQTALMAEQPRRETALAWLEMCDGEQTRHAVSITNLRIGRGRHNDLVFRNDSVSGNHAVLEYGRDGAWSITDLNSGNGVIVNGQQETQVTLSEGDVIELGEIKMRFLPK